MDRGLLLVMAGLLFAAVLAHRYWRRTIRLEDQLAATEKDLAFHLGRYRRAWRTLEQRAALVERATGLVTEATPGWVTAGLPALGQTIYGANGAEKAHWSTLPAPGADGSVGPALVIQVGGRPFRATPLGEESLGLVLVEPE